MCTLILGRDILDQGSLLVGANRDEDPARPADPPARLSEAQHVVGGRDIRGGGTWLAVRDARSVVAVLNRRGLASAPPEALRSRGLLALDVACAAPGAGDDAFANAALAAALASVASVAYAPFSLVCATPAGGWVLGHDGSRTAEPQAIERGWHVLTHGEVDDAAEPRTVRLARKLAGFQPRDTAEAETRVLELLSLHGTFGDGAPPLAADAMGGAEAADRAAVCIHSGRMVTVSTSVFRLARKGARYIHVEGRPCVTPPSDLPELLEP
jgi:uncharacterized protein with NRDE domain